MITAQEARALLPKQDNEQELAYIEDLIKTAATAGFTEGLYLAEVSKRTFDLLLRLGYEVRTEWKLGEGKTFIKWDAEH